MPVWRIYLFALVVIVMAVSFAYLRFGRPASEPNPAPIAIEQTLVTDAALLEKANPTFYAGVKDGDIVMRYDDRLELYRPSEKRVIRSAPIAK